MGSYAGYDTDTKMSTLMADLLGDWNSRTRGYYLPLFNSVFAVRPWDFRLVSDPLKQFVAQEFEVWHVGSYGTHSSHYHISVRSRRIEEFSRQINRRFLRPSEAMSLSIVELHKLRADKGELLAIQNFNAHFKSWAQHNTIKPGTPRNLNRVTNANYLVFFALAFSFCDDDRAEICQAIYGLMSKAASVAKKEVRAKAIRNFYVFLRSQTHIGNSFASRIFQVVQKRQAGYRKMSSARSAISNQLESRHEHEA